LGLLISNFALVETELDAKGPENLMQFCTAKFSESIVCDISSTLTRACSVPDPNSGNNCENDVYLQSPNQSINLRNYTVRAIIPYKKSFTATYFLSISFGLVKNIPRCVLK
jgi:hypothetical protein